MKKTTIKFVALLLAMALLAGCTAAGNQPPKTDDVQENQFDFGTLPTVGINWDAAEQGEKMITHNEIDVIMMHGMVPVFVSCKSGMVEMEELFKFATVADRFGGDYAKRVLVAPSLTGLNNEESIRARAEDMNIQILDNAYTMPFMELKDTVSGLWNTTLKRN